VTDAVIAFGAGLVSFATPCVLPLVPAYLSSIGIRPGGPRRSLAAALPFVAGFTLVFVVLGVLAGLAGATLSDHREQLTKLSGIVIVAMGLGMLGLLRSRSSSAPWRRPSSRHAARVRHCSWVARSASASRPA
jgi:cytochrome c biogenesis protein CcdA